MRTQKGPGKARGAPELERHTVTLLDGSSFSLEPLGLLDALVKFSGTWSKWELTRIREGWIVFKRRGKRAYLINGETWKWVLRIWASEREAFERTDSGLPRSSTRAATFRRLDKKLKKGFWKQLRGASPDVYVNFARGAILDPSHSGRAEKLEGHLNKYGTSWGSLKAVRSIDETAIDDAWFHQGLAAGARGPLTKRWKKYDSAVKLIVSAGPAFSERVKKGLLKEHKALKSPTAVRRQIMRDFPKSVGAALRRLLGANAKYVNKELPPLALVSRILSVLIVQLVDELRSVGMSKNMSFGLADEILHLLCPRYWSSPDEYSADRVRRRYRYWSQKLKS